MVSCKKNEEKKDCISKEINEAFLTKYLIVKDTCNTFKGLPNVKYYNNNRLLMSGFSERNDKRGNWYFYSQNEKEEVSGLFEKSQPKGKWNFKNLGELNWDIYKNSNKGYLVSYPNDWKFAESEEGNSVVIFDKNSQSFEDYNLKMIITSVKLDEMEDSVEEIYKNTIDDFSKKGYKDIKYKKVDIDTFNEVYELQYEELLNETKYLNTEIFYSYKKQFYILSFSIRKETVYDYSIIKEILDTSFKVYSN
jgi:hypothetical protein